jgi:hypothetical protein
VGITALAWQKKKKKKKLVSITDKEWCHPKHKYEHEVEKWTIFWNEVALSNG